MKIKNTLILPYLLLIFAASCPMPVFSESDDEGAVPDRIVSLGSTLTEEIFLLGAEDKLVGTTVYCNRPSAAQLKNKIGTVVNVDIEKIVSLRPQLVLATSLTDPREKKKLEDVGMNVVVFTQPKDFAQICDQFLTLGQLVGKKKEAEEIVATARARVEEIKKKTISLPRVRIFVQIGARPLFAATSDSFIHDLITSAGGTNIAADAKTGLYSRERVLKENPDVILIATMGIVGVEEKKIWSGYKTLNASGNSKIYIFDAYKICSPTPLTFSATLEEIFDILHAHDQ